MIAHADEYNGMLDGGFESRTRVQCPVRPAAVRGLLPEPQAALSAAVALLIAACAAASRAIGTRGAEQDT